MSALTAIPTFVLFTTLVGDWFDRWREKHTEHIQPYDAAAPRRWGWLKFDKTGESAFFVKLPSYAFEYDPCRDEPCWQQRILAWRSWRGWSVDLWPVWP